MAILADHPSNTEALTAFGELKFQLGDVSGARELFIAAAKLKPLDPGYLSNLGASLRAQGLLAEAKALYLRALALDPGCTAALNNLGNLWLQQHEPTAARDCFMRLQAIEGATRRVSEGLARAGALDKPKGAG